jgi:hypothetical protein
MDAMIPVQLEHPPPTRAEGRTDRRRIDLEQPADSDPISGVTVGDATRSPPPRATGAHTA